MHSQCTVRHWDAQSGTEMHSQCTVRHWDAQSGTDHVLLPDLLPGHLLLWSALENSPLSIACLASPKTNNNVPSALALSQTGILIQLQNSYNTMTLSSWYTSLPFHKLLSIPPLIQFSQLVSAPELSPYFLRLLLLSQSFSPIISSFTIVSDSWFSHTFLIGWAIHELLNLSHVTSFSCSWPKYKNNILESVNTVFPFLISCAVGERDL